METLFFAFLASWFFWPVIAVLLIATWCAAERTSGWAVIATVVLGFLLYKGSPAVVDFLSDPIRLIGTIVAYVVLGVAWSFLKWYLTINKVRTKLVELRDKFLEKHKLPSGFFATPVDPSNQTSVEMTDKYRDHLRNAFPTAFIGNGDTIQEAVDSIRPKAAKHKMSIIYWIGYWPLSVVWFVISDMVREVAEWVYARVAGTFQRLSDRMFADAI